MRRTEIPKDIFFGDDDEDADEDEQQDSSEVAEPEPESEQVDDEENGEEEASEPEEGESQKTEKMQISVYLTKPTARKLDAVRFELQYDHDVKLSKSDLAEFAIGRLDRNIDEIIEAAENGAFDW